MLTKDLLKYKMRKIGISPEFVAPDDAHHLSTVGRMCQVLEQGKGSTQQQLKDAIEDTCEHMDSTTQGFEKLLLDRCEWEEPPVAIEESRWELLHIAEDLRTSEIFTDAQAFRQQVAERMSKDVSQLQEGIYADLAEFRTLTNFKAIKPQEVLHRYNCAQIQGLLLTAKEIEIHIPELPLAKKRALFRALRFFQLIPDVQAAEDKSFSFSLSGPLSIFEGQQKYGMRIANFFPYLLQLPEFSLHAQIKCRKGILPLKIDHSVGIKSHYKELTGYVPEEFQNLAQTLCEKKPELKLEVGADFLPIGRQSYCFPDFVITGKDSQKSIAIELFHRWHAGALKNRLETLEKQKYPDLRIGVCRSIAGRKEMKAYLEKSKTFEKYGFFFRDYPTAKTLIGLTK